MYPIDASIVTTSAGIEKYKLNASAAIPISITMRASISAPSAQDGLAIFFPCNKVEIAAA